MLKNTPPPARLFLSFDTTRRAALRCDGTLNAEELRTIEMKLTLAAAAVLALSSPLAAQTLINTPEEIMAVARAYGTATLDTEGRDRPLMTGTMEGTNYGVLMYGCAGNRDCESIQLFATFTTENRDLALLNSWNEDQRFGTAYVNASGRVFLHWSVNLDYGISRQNLIDSFDIWRLTMIEFRGHVAPR